MSDPPAAQPRRSTDAELRRIKPFLKAMSLIQTGLIKATGGRMFSTFKRAPVGLLTTTGRKSGKRRTTPLIYLADGDKVLLVASQGGATKHPIWYLNLAADPHVAFQIRGRQRRYQARSCDASEKARYWPSLCDIYPEYADYQKRTDREIPVVMLEPV